VKTRLIYIAAAALVAAALALPLWGFAMSAPQYPGETLHLQISRTGISGDVHEISALQKYIGVRFPTELPELTWVTSAIGGLAFLLLVAAVAGTNTAARVYRTGCALAMVALLLASAAAVQARLYEAGHERDPQAPLRSVRDFTPPLVGPVKVGNFTVWSYPHLGAVALLAAAALSVVGTRRSTRPDGRTQLGRRAGRLWRDKAVA
jgi:hypothetical protein